MPEFKRSQAKYVKKPYKISAWSEYEKSLRQRGSLTIWISDDADLSEFALEFKV